MSYLEKTARNKLIQALFLLEVGSAPLVGALAIAELRPKDELARMSLALYDWPGQMSSIYGLSIENQTLLELYSVFAVFGIMVAMIASCYVLLKLPYKRSAVIATIIITMFGFKTHTHLTDWLTGGSYSRYQEAKTELESLTPDTTAPNTNSSIDEMPSREIGIVADEKSAAEDIAKLKELLKNTTDDEEAAFLENGIAAAENLLSGDIGENEFLAQLFEVDEVDQEQDLPTLWERYLLLVREFEPYALAFKVSFQLASIILAAMIILDPWPHRLLARRRQSGDLRDGIEASD
ncbi:hypothetical protein FMN50_00555 [Rhodobacterales bacterium]|nr:hypothetical protein FMN50_00555 [Rhodobacterales bacterium]